MKQKKKMSLLAKQSAAGWVFLTPATILIAIMAFWPMIQAFIMSINGTLQLFDESVNLTNGGPANSTITMSHYIFNNSFGQGAVSNFGYATAMCFFVFVIVAVLAFINMKVGDTRD